jgi:histone deacetylase 1/2
MAHNLIVNYNLYKEMDVFRPPLIDHAELTRFHSDDYVNFLRTISPDNMHEHLRELQRFNVGEDCAWPRRGCGWVCGARRGDSVTRLQ